MVADFAHASIVEGVRFTAQIGVPNVIQGLFKKRELPTRVASLARAEAQGFALVHGLVKRHGPGPFYVRVATDEALLLHAPADIEFVLGGSPDPFASDPEAKKKGMTAFQPHALTISRGNLWQNRRAFAESVLATGQPLHPLAGTFLQVCAEAADELGEHGQHEGITWGDLNDAFQRITRRVVFGEAAAADTELTRQLGELMAAGNSTPGKPAEGYDAFVAHLQRYVDDPDVDSLVGLFAKAPHDPSTRTTEQVIHWLFAMGDTLAANLMRCLALLSTHPEQLHEVRTEIAGADLADAQQIAAMDYLGGCLLEAMRLWPTTPLFGRVTTRDVTFPGGQVVKEGTQVLIYNVFNHRNRDRVPFADRFAPGEWASGDAGESWQFNFFSHGPQGCPGAGLSIFLGQAFLAHTLAYWTPTLRGGSGLAPGSALPHGLDLYGLTVDLERRGWAAQE
ncbi:MAG TPA: cytochrome P450 [Nocardioidaceae bacterium]|nr:cytochrome P450 [Nocardioidaceae bacterium]